MVMVGFVASAVIVAAVLMGVAHQMYVSLALQGATDRAALAAADAQVGVTPAMPCVLAGELLHKEGFALVSCEQETSGVRVVGEVWVGGLQVTKRARAGVVDGGKQ